MSSYKWALNKLKLERAKELAGADGDVRAIYERLGGAVDPHYKEEAPMKEEVVEEPETIIKKVKNDNNTCPG